jgi:hypothetical protein
LKSAAGAFERLVLPELNSIKGEIKALHVETASNNRSQESMKSELLAVMRARCQDRETSTSF